MNAPSRSRLGGLLRRQHRQQGQSATEFLIVFPVLIFLTLGAIQWAMIYQARSTLNHAALLAARAGAVNNGNKEKMYRGMAAGLAPLYASKAELAEIAAARAKAYIEVKLPGVASIEVLNPTPQAFTDFGRARLDLATPGSDREIPNDTLNYRNTSPGASSGINVQDANLLHVRVNYCYRMLVPVIGRMIEAVSNPGLFGHSLKSHGMSDPFGIGSAPLLPGCGAPLAKGPRIRIQSEAVVRMQSPFFRSNL